MKERIFLPSDIAAAVERRAAAAGVPAEVMGARLLAEGAVLTLRDLLLPCIAPDAEVADEFAAPAHERLAGLLPSDAATPPALAEGATSDPSRQTHAKRQCTAWRPVEGASGATPV